MCSCCSRQSINLNNNGHRHPPSGNISVPYSPQPDTPSNSCTRFSSKLFSSSSSSSQRNMSTNHKCSKFCFRRRKTCCFSSPSSLSCCCFGIKQIGLFDRESDLSDKNEQRLVSPVLNTCKLAKYELRFICQMAIFSKVFNFVTAEVTLQMALKDIAS